MSTVSTLMVVKVLAIVGLGAAFVWWQMRDLAREKKSAEQPKATPDNEAP